jgi:hypothetical protein
MLKTTRPSSSATKKEWEKYTPVGELRVWEVDLLAYNFERFKLDVVANLGRDSSQFRKFIKSLIRCGEIKWQAIIANSCRYGPKKFAYLTLDQDLFEFVECVYEAINSKLSIKLVIENPQAKAMQLEHVSPSIAYSHRMTCVLISVMLPGA